MSVQLARYLKDFSPPPRVRPSLFPSSGQNAGGASPDASALSFPDPPVDVAAERAEAFAEGRAEAEVELGARHAAALAALAETHRAEMETMKSRYEQDYAAALAERFATLADEVADRIAGEAAMVLAPVLEDALTGRAVEDLARMVREGLHAGEAVTVTVKGPSALFEQLQSHFEASAPAFRHVETQDVDLTVEFGETVLVTRMAAWADTVRKVLA
ncbi:hypothetical protein KYK29_17965 [Shinella daejeonensis]|uniref:hypothetical protein n=1 Tax=Shinella daejeonensis TaxID=659017 RepID=UPI0020C8186C|nr:hypothetical protein [Shinella daejeonensis]MCP8896816.1 hypothetical protein [Shinella daejeonensis]